MSWRLIIHDRVGSTQDVAKKLAVAGEPEGVAIMALQQTTGRGRKGRKWESGASKDLALSLLLRPDVPPWRSPLLGFLAAVAVARTITPLIPRPAQVRWPNDVLVEGKKVAGILAEGTVQGDALRFVILGVGLNVNSTLEDFPPELHDRAISVFMVRGQIWDLQAAANSFLREFALLYDEMRIQGTAFIVPLWESLWAHRGAILERDGVKGVAEGINPDGSLRLKLDDGSVMVLSSGEVFPVDR